MALAPTERGAILKWLRNPPLINAHAFAFRHTDKLFEQAARWHARMQDADVSADQRTTFRAWLARDSAHEQVYAEVERLWAALDVPAQELLNSHAGERLAPHASDRRTAQQHGSSLRKPRDVYPESSGTPGPFGELDSRFRENDEQGVAAGDQNMNPVAQRSAHARMIGRQPNRLMHRIALAASLLLGIAGGFWWYSGGLDNLQSDYVAGVGERETIELADGSEITLNTDTAIAVDLDADQRVVRMFRGEAYFDVARVDDSTFTVQTDVAQVQVTGTAFNVRAQDDRAIVSVFSGHVEAAANSRTARSVSLSANRQSTIDAGGTNVPEPFDATAVSAWRRGQMVFYRTPMIDVVEELNRYHRGRIVIVNRELQQRTVSGVFDTDRPLAALSAIERILHLQSIHLTKYLILLR